MPDIVVDACNFPQLDLLFLLVQILLQNSNCINVWKNLLNELSWRDLETFTFKTIADGCVGGCGFLSDESFFSEDLAYSKEEAVHWLTSHLGVGDRGSLRQSTELRTEYRSKSALSFLAPYILYYRLLYISIAENHSPVSWELPRLNYEDLIIWSAFFEEHLTSMIEGRLERRQKLGQHGLWPLLKEWQFLQEIEYLSHCLAFNLIEASCVIGNLKSCKVAFCHTVYYHGLLNLSCLLLKSMVIEVSANLSEEFFVIPCLLRIGHLYVWTSIISWSSLTRSWSVVLNEIWRRYPFLKPLTGCAYLITFCNESWDPFTWMLGLMIDMLWPMMTENISTQSWWFQVLFWFLACCSFNAATDKNIQLIRN